MKTTFIKSALILAIATGIFSSCVNDEAYSVPSIACNEIKLEKTIEVAAVPASPNVAQYLKDDIIEAYVTSSDKGGNFYKSISFQTKDGSKAFSIPVDETSTFINFSPGRKVFVKLKDLYTDVSNGGMRIGGIYLSNGNAQVGRLSLQEYRQVLRRSCTVLNEDDFVKQVTITELKMDSNINKLVELSNVQFSDAAITTTYFDANNQIGGATNHLLVDAMGNSVVFRTSGFASYAYNAVKSGNGKVRGVLTKFSGTYQFVVREESDIKLEGERISVDFAAPIVGTELMFNASYSEDFESYGTTTPGNRIFPKYINDPVVGSRYWENKTFSNNKYLQMSSFGGTAEANRNLFFIPVDFTGASNFSFQTKAGFANGLVLKVYYISAVNYTAGGTFTEANLINITSSFTVPAGSATGYPATFSNSGNYVIPASLTGNGYFVFEYIGNGNLGLTTTLQLDNIVIN
jgi:hypothetical protein